MPDDVKKSFYVISKLFFSLWVVRGFLAAISLTAIVTNGTSLEKFEFLRAVFFVVQEWNNLLSVLSERLAEIINIKLSEIDLNIIIVLFATVVPGLGAIASRQVVGFEKISDKVITASLWFVASVFLLSISFWTLRGFFSSRTNYQLKQYFGPLYDAEGMLLILIGLLLVCGIAAFRMIRGYLQGIVVFLTMIVALQIMYVLESPAVSAWINEAVCAKLTTELSACNE